MLARNVSQIGLDTEALRPLGLLVWLIRSRSEYLHFIGDVAGRPGREALRRSLFVGLWERTGSASFFTPWEPLMKQSNRLNCPKALIQDSGWGVMVGYAPEKHSAIG